MPPAATGNAAASGPRTPWLADDVPGGVGADPAATASGMKASPVERPHAEDVLQVERAEQEEPEDRAGRGEHQEEAAADGAIRQPLDPQQRRVGAALAVRRRP